MKIKKGLLNLSGNFRPLNTDFDKYAEADFHENIWEATLPH